MNPSDDQQNYEQGQQSDQAISDYPEGTYRPNDLEAIDDKAVPMDTASESKVTPEVDEPPVRWAAKEYVELDKGVGWYVLFVIIVVALIVVDIFLLRSYTFSLLVVVMAVAVVVYTRRPPREIQYTLSGRQGLYVGERLYHLSDFRAFGLIKDGDHHSIMLIPVKRFSPGVSVYFPEEAGEQIVDILGQRLPMETLKLDAIDILVRKLRL